MPDHTWKALVVCFLVGKTVEQTSRELNISKYKVLKATSEIRNAMRNVALGKMDGFEDTLRFIRFWKITLCNEDPDNIDNIAFISSEFEDGDEKGLRKFTLLTKKNVKAFFKILDGKNKDCSYFAKYIPVLQSKKRSLHLVYDRLGSDNTIHEEERIKKYFGNFDYLTNLINKYILRRKGVNASNLSLHCAAVIWRYRNRALTRLEKIEEIRRLVVKA